MNLHFIKLGKDISKVGLELDTSIRMLLNNKNLLLKFVNHFVWQGASELIKKEKELVDVEDANKERIKHIREYEKSPPIHVQLNRAIRAECGEEDLSKQKTEELILSIEKECQVKREVFNKQKDEFYQLGTWMSEHTDEFIEFMHEGLKKMQKSSKSFEIDILRLVFIESLYASETHDLSAFSQLQEIIKKYGYIFISDISAFSQFETLSVFNIKLFYQKLGEYVPIEKLAKPVIIDSQNPYFRFFFALAIRQCRIEQLDVFLEFQSKKCKENFNLFLKTIVIEYSDLINPLHVIVINELLDKREYSIRTVNDTKKTTTDKANKPEMSVKQKLKLVIPLFFFKYESEIELGEKQKMPKNWRELKELFFTKSTNSQPPLPLKPNNQSNPN